MKTATPRSERKTARRNEGGGARKEKVTGAAPEKGEGEKETRTKKEVAPEEEVPREGPQATVESERARWGDLRVGVTVHDSDNKSVYRLVRYLAAGGFGQVWVATRIRSDARTERHPPTVAIKFIRVAALSAPEIGGGGAGGAEELSEIALQRHLAHPNVLPSLQVFLYDGATQQYLAVVMPRERENVAETLARWNADRKQVTRADDVARRCRLIRDIGCGVAYMAANGFVHADLKPANVLMGWDGVARIADLGLSRLVAGAKLGREPNFLATWPWRAPELVCGRRDYDAHVDEWALGCIVNEIAFLIPPFGLLARLGGDSKTANDALVTRDIGARLGFPRSFHELVRAGAEHERSLPAPHAELVRACEAAFALYPDLTGADDHAGFALDRYEALWLAPETRRPLAEYYGADLYRALWHYVYDLLHVDPRARRNDGHQSEALFGAYPCRVAPRSPAKIHAPRTEPDFQDDAFAGVRPLTRQFAQHLWNQLLLTGQVPRDDPERTRWRVGAAVLAAQLMDDKHTFDVGRYRVGFAFETRLMQALGDDPWRGFIVD